MELVRNLEKFQRKLSSDRINVRNILGDNPYKVKNFIYTEGLDNSLIPKDLLKEKVNDFADDEEYIQDFLSRKKIQDAKEMK